MIPWIARHVTVPLVEGLAGKRPMPLYRRLLRTQFDPPEVLRARQLARLRELVAWSLDHTRDYATLAGLPRDWQPRALDDLAALPLLDKTILSEHREGLLAADVPGGASRYTTGGSSGQPLIFYWDRARRQADVAHRLRAHQWWGILPGDREAYVWGSPVELRAQDRLRTLRDRMVNHLLLSAFDLSEQAVGEFVTRIRRFRPKCLYGYPSSIALLCRFAADAGLDLTDLGVKVVFATAEVLYEDQRDLISSALGGAAVANGYGSREGGFIAHQCPHGRMHITDESIIAEFLAGDRPAAPGEDGEIVITNLDNRAMPFVRYRTGDIGRRLAGPCPCGRTLEIISEPMGRSTDFILAPDGRWVHGLALIYVLRELPGVRKYQIVQPQTDRIEVKIVVSAGEGFPADGEARIREGIARRLGASVLVVVTKVDSIPEDASGKFRYVISHVAQRGMGILPMRSTGVSPVSSGVAIAAATILPASSPDGTRNGEDRSETDLKRTGKMPVSHTGGTPVPHRHMLAFDVEEYFQVEAAAGAIGPEQWESFESRVAPCVDRILGLLAEHSQTATFFVLGWLAKRQGELVRRIAQSGHEVASHGMSHRMIERLSREELLAELADSRKLLEDLSGRNVAGFRAPTFSITHETAWALDVLVEAGYEYDSSIFPVRHDRYGVPDAPRWIHIAAGPGGNRLVEIPPLTLRALGANLPAAGGGYLRLFPTAIIAAAIRQAQRAGKPAMIYLHPWELDPDQPPLPIARLSLWRHRVNLHKTEAKLRQLMRQFRFTSVRDHLTGAAAPANVFQYGR